MRVDVLCWCMDECNVRMNVDAWMSDLWMMKGQGTGQDVGQFRDRGVS